MAKDDQDKRAQIWNFVLEHEGFFCDPPPEGLGFPRPGMIPGHYLKRPEEWALDQDPCPEAETGASAPGRHRQPHRLDRHVPRHAPAPGRHQAAHPGGAHPGGHIRPARRHGGRRTQRPSPGTGSLTTQDSQGPIQSAGDRATFREDLGQVLARRDTSQWKRAPKIAGCYLKSRSWAGRTRRRCFVCDSPAWPMHTVRPRGGDYGQLRLLRPRFRGDGHLGRPRGKTGR